MSSSIVSTTEPIPSRCMAEAVQLAKLCTPIPTAFCVGCLITIAGTSQVVSTGYSREIEGNTHAEQCALQKLQDSTQTTMADLDLYTTMEPCSTRLSGQTPCAELILNFNRTHSPKLQIKKVYLGVFEPLDFVNCQGVQLLTNHGLSVIEVVGFNEECLKIARGQGSI